MIRSKICPKGEICYARTDFRKQKNTDALGVIRVLCDEEECMVTKFEGFDNHFNN